MVKPRHGSLGDQRTRCHQADTLVRVFEENARVVAAGTPIMEVGDPSDLEAEIELLSSDAVNVNPGAEVSIGQWGGSAPLRGRVTLVEPEHF